MAGLSQRKVCFLAILIILLSPLVFFNVELPASYWEEMDVSLATASEAQQATVATPATPQMKIIILTMDRFDSLERLIRSLKNTDYQGDTVDLVIKFDLPKTMLKANEAWRDRIKELESNLIWDAGELTITVAPQNMGLRQAWIEAWRPSHAEERAIILEDDVEVSTMWYEWLKGSYSAYGHRDDIAGFSLQRQTLVPDKTAPPGTTIPDNGGRPFLYKLVGSIGYAPMPLKWLDFISFAECALETRIRVDTPQLVTSDWYNKLDQRGMWTQLFIFFCDYYNLYTLYAFPSPNLALAAHWREKGEHFGTTAGRDFELVEAGNEWSVEFPSDLSKLDWNAKPEVASGLKTLVLTAAVGYDLEEFERFLRSLREHYDSGDIAILVWEKASKEIFKLLDFHQVLVVKTPEAGGPRVTDAWRKVNTVRWQFYQDLCQPGKYDLCLAVDFRDSLFQDDPFRNMRPGKAGEAVLHLYEHGIAMNSWHLDMAMSCKGRNQVLKNKKIINAGGFVASPEMLPQLAKWIVHDAKNCDDQVALNLAVYGKLFNASTTVHPQGQGSINNVAWGGKFTMDDQGRYLNHNCFPSPVVHQFDMVKK